MIERRLASDAYRIHGVVEGDDFFCGEGNSITRFPLWTEMDQTRARAHTDRHTDRHTHREKGDVQVGKEKNDI